MVDRLGEPGRGAVLVQLPLTRSDLAAMTGSTTEPVSRAMSRPRGEGVIETGRRWTSIIDRDRLAPLVDAGAARRKAETDGDRRYGPAAGTTGTSLSYRRLLYVHA